MYRLFATALLIVSVSWADTLVLKNGRSVSGSYLGGDSRQIRLAVDDRIETFSVSDVVRIEFGSLASPGAAPPSESSAAAPAPAASRDERPSALRDRTSPPPSAPSRASGAEIPAGTTITVRMNDPVDSRADSIGQTYRASLDEPIMIDGEVVLDRGADVVAKLVDDKESGRLAGKTVLTLDLQSITIDGRNIPLATEEVTRASDSRTRRTATAAGGLAALGAIIGGIAGGGKGAAIGAVSGAGAGAATSVMMKGERVNIPSETRLTFTLQQPLRI
jgi:hypothetical protein